MNETEIIKHISALFKNYEIRFKTHTEVILLDNMGKSITLVLNPQTRELIEIK